MSSLTGKELLGAVRAELEIASQACCDDGLQKAAAVIHRLHERLNGCCLLTPEEMVQVRRTVEHYHTDEAPCPGCAALALVTG